MMTSSCFGRLLAACVLLLLAACKSDDLIPPPLPDQSVLYWDLELNHHAVTLSMVASYDTLTLVAMPRNVHAEPLAGLPVPQYVSRDPEHVLVTPEGVLFAVAPMTPERQTSVVATLTTGNLKHTDSVLVTVVDNSAPTPLATFTIQPVPPDSAKLGAVMGALNMPMYDTLRARMTDAAGATMHDVLVSFRSLDTTVARVGPITGQVQPVVPGTAPIVGSATVFGVARADTVPYRVGYPVASLVIIRPRIGGEPGHTIVQPEVTVGAGAVVMWQAFSADTTAEIDVVFAKPANVAAFSGASIYEFVPEIYRFFCQFLGQSFSCGDGNFVLRSVGGSHGGAFRTFPISGRYEYHSPGQGFSGSVVVVDER